MSRRALDRGVSDAPRLAAAPAEPLAPDASLRRYLRLTGGPRPAVLMDAPAPDDIGAFIRIALHLTRIEVSAQKILAADPVVGLLLEEGLGDRLLTCGWDTSSPTLPGRAGEAAEGAGSLILDNVVALVAMQRAAPPPDLAA
jgi:aminoglycoside/choline kinase family phosphotransferase